MSISNCWAAGAESFTQPITGVVQRRDEVTGMVEAAKVRGNGVAEEAVKPVQNGASLSSAVMGAILGFEG